jgi:signal transduction histidine kinase
MIELEKLGRIRVFADLPRDRLEWLSGHVSEYSIQAGDVLLHEGDMAASLTILFDGELTGTRRADGQQYVERFSAPEAFGTPCMLASIPYPMTLTATTDCRLASLPEAAFRELFVSCGPFSQAVARVMTDWLTALETESLNRSRLAALGKLAAGLAHEMNNPAAALTRALDYMRRELGGLEASALALGVQAVPDEALDKFRALVASKASGRDSETADPIGQSERESQLVDWLAAHGVTKPWLVAPVFAARDIAPDDLRAIADDLTPEQFNAAIGWIARLLDLRSVMDDAMHGANRISDIVAAMKSYSFMDRGPQQEIDLHEGIDDTLTVMTHEMKRGMAVTRDYDRSLPRIQAFGSELNQVWTRIIENAIEAMNGQGNIAIRTRRDGNYAVIEIADDGPGLPPDTVAHLFEPFFTSKRADSAQGQSVGLGLHLAYRIVVNRHGGTIGVRSDAAGTVFRVTLPLVGARSKGDGSERRDALVL